LDKDDLPTGATVKLFGYVTGAAGDQEVKLLTVAGVDVTDASFGATGTTVFDISGDFAANLTSGNTAYTIQHRYTGSSGSTHSVGLIIEW
jgi:hypothetical protein